MRKALLFALTISLCLALGACGGEMEQRRAEELQISFQDLAAASVEAGRAMAFLITGWTSILHVLTVRSRSMLYKYRIRDNPQLYISCFVMLAVFAAMAAIPPVASAIGLGALGWQQWLISAALSLLPLLVAEYGKVWDAVRSRNAERTRV